MQRRFNGQGYVPKTRVRRAVRALTYARALQTRPAASLARTPTIRRLTVRRMNQRTFAFAERVMSLIEDRFVAVERTVHGVLVRQGITALRVTVGVVFLGFGVLKFFPGVSPAEGLAIKTIDLLSFGVLPWRVGIIAIASLECFIGICLLANRWMRLAVWLLAAQLVGVLAPIVLLTGRLFSGPHHAPTLEGQYVLKDIILVAAGMVIAAGTFRGGRLVRDEPQGTG